jgi:transcriptional regulator with XRE-family HTH domain
MMPDSEPRPVRRYLKLINELWEERGGAHGAQTALANLVGVSQGYMSKLLNGHRVSVGVEAIDGAIHGLRLNPLYFFGSKEPRTYRDYVNHEPPFAEWREFLATDLGKSLTDAERDAFRSLDLSSWEPSVAFYQQVLLAIRGLSADDAADTVAANKAAVAGRRRAKSDPLDKDG